MKASVAPIRCNSSIKPRSISYILILLLILAPVIVPTATRADFNDRIRPDNAPVKVVPPVQVTERITLFSRSYRSSFVPIPSTPLLDDFSLPPDAAEPFEMTIKGRGVGSVQDMNDAGVLIVDVNDDLIEPKFNPTKIIIDLDSGSFRAGWFIDHRSRVRLAAMNRIAVSNFKMQVSGNLLHFGQNFKIEITAARSTPPDDSGSAACASALDRTVATDIFEATKCLYEGTDRVQLGVDPDHIDRKRVAVLRGQVFARDKTPLAGVAIGVLNHTEFGTTQTQPDGKFAMVVNGGERLTVTYAKDKLLPIQRSVQPTWRDYAWLAESVMIPMDEPTDVDLSAPAPLGIHLARGAVVSEGGTDRQATLLIPDGTEAEMVLADGEVKTLSKLKLRATEYTTGENGVAAMPGELPSTSGFTYAIDYTDDQALNAGATQVRFKNPVFHYVENFVDIPVGTPVPVGYYDMQKAVWLPSDNGLVIKIHSIIHSPTEPDIATIEIDGNPNAASDSALSALGITIAERQKLTALYSTGQELWRVPITHFTPLDCNWPLRSTTRGRGTQSELVEDTPVNNSDSTCGSIIDCQNQALGEVVGIVGTPFSLIYRSDRAAGRKTGYEIQIPLLGESFPSILRAVQLEVLVAGRRFTSEFILQSNRLLPFKADQLFPLEGNQTRFNWDGERRLRPCLARQTTDHHQNRIRL